MNTADQLTTHPNHLISPNPPQFQNIILSNDHCANDNFQTLHLIKSNTDSVRKAAEAYLIERDKTLSLNSQLHGTRANYGSCLGINKKDEM